MPIRLCIEPRCGNEQVYRGRCATHARSRERETHRNKGIYNSRRWKFARRAQLAQNPLCAGCGRIASDVDHVTPIEHGGAVWDPLNYQSLCQACHSVKTRREQEATR